MPANRKSEPRSLTARGAATRARIVDAVTDVLDQMHNLGVAHGDIRLPNVLRGPTGEVTIIDFECAMILPAAARDAMSAISRNKRRRLMEDEMLPTPDSEKTDKRPESILYRAKRREDKSDAQTLFTLDNGRLIRA